jgi:hypothetical protein
MDAFTCALAPATIALISPETFPPIVPVIVVPEAIEMPIVVPPSP